MLATHENLYPSDFLVNTYGDNLKSDIVQVAHHGFNGAKKELYELIDAVTVLWPQVKNYYRPIIVDYSAHSFRNYVSWDEIETAQGTHPVAYTAQGSHGMWKDAGTHVYVDAKIVKLTDECSQGTAWELWQENQMETYSYDALTHTGKGIGSSEWKTEFDLDYLDENSNAILRWGNNGWYPPIQIYPQLQYAPGGPQQKKSLNDYYALNNRATEIY